MKITLVCPTNYNGESATKGIYYPMGILLVGSLVKDTFQDWDVKIVDGELFSQPELERLISGCDVLGLSANTDNYQYCLELAKFAKSNGTRKVVTGGPHASAILSCGDNRIPMADVMLRNQKCIDEVIVNDGDEPFLQYLIELQKQRPDFSRIDNIYTRNGNQIVHGSIAIPTKLPRLTEMNFSLMDLTRYWEEHRIEFPAMPERFVEGFTHVGCAWREKAGCTFCDIPYPINNYQVPGKFWRDLIEARERFDIGSFKDYGDCLTGNIERVKTLLSSRPADLSNITISCYGRSSEISEEMADLLAGLNVKYIYIGFDSGDNQMLRNMQEGYTAKANLKAAERLLKRGINITGSLILGARGESIESIANTEELAKELHSHPNVTQLHCAMLTPFPGAPMNRAFLQAHPEYLEKDVWDTEVTKKFWVQNYCEAPFDYIEEKARAINDLNPSKRKRYFGIKRPANSSPSPACQGIRPLP